MSQEEAIMRFDEIVREATAEWEGLQRGDKPLILVGSATCGRSAGALEVLAAFQRELENRDRKSVV